MNPHYLHGLIAGGLVGAFVGLTFGIWVAVVISMRAKPTDP